MIVLISPDYAGLCEQAVQVIADAVTAKPDLRLGLATGRTPVGVYQKLIFEPLDWSRVHFFSLDEFLDLPANRTGSLNDQLKKWFLGPIGARSENVHLIDPGDYDRVIEEYGGIDLQILGIGQNGHIGFNEPGSPADSRTRTVNLAVETRRAYSKGFGGLRRTPRMAITMGVGSILKGRKLLLLASGRKKADIVRRALEGPIGPQVPASALQLHRNLEAVLDAPAASKLGFQPILA